MPRGRKHTGGRKAVGDGQDLIDRLSVEGKDLLGDKDAGGGRVQVLSIDTIDLVTSVQVGVALTKSVLGRVG